MYEVELKLKTGDLAAIRSRLVDLGAEMLDARTEEDRYYNAPERDFQVTDEALRLRFDGHSWSLTYKGPKLPAGKLKSREEYACSVDSGKECDLILNRLGYRLSGTVKKRREIYTFHGATVALDEVESLGTFIEIEVLAEEEIASAASRVEEVSALLRVEGAATTTSYLELVLANR